MIIDAESKTYLKPNKINEARLKLLLGIQQSWQRFLQDSTWHSKSAAFPEGLPGALSSRVSQLRLLAGGENLV